MPTQSQQRAYAFSQLCHSVLICKDKKSDEGCQTAEEIA
jgi:hypothetical protein